ILSVGARCELQRDRLKPIGDRSVQRANSWRRPGRPSRENMMQRNRMMLVCAALLSTALGCNKDKAAEQKLAPTASALEAAMPKAPTAQPFAVDPASSSFKFLMDSPLEKIDGDAPKSIQGDLYIDPADLSKSTALIKADLNLLTLYQQKRGDDKGEYSE